MHAQRGLVEFRRDESMGGFRARGVLQREGSGCIECSSVRFRSQTSDVHTPDSPDDRNHAWGISLRLVVTAPARLAHLQGIVQCRRYLRERERLQ